MNAMNAQIGTAPAHFTIIRSLAPVRLGKTYSVDANGKLVKTVAASIWQGRATTLEATPKNLVAALKRTTESESEVIVLSSFIGATPGSPAEIEVVTENKLESLKGLKKGEIGAPAAGELGYFYVKGKIVSARLKRLMRGSGWILLERDLPPGMPDAWKQLTFAECFALLDRPGLVPGISTCLRIEYRGSSARVVSGSGAQDPEATHALIQISDASKTDWLREHIKVQATLEGLAFDLPRYSRKEPGKVTGAEKRTLFDLAVLVDGRLVLNPKPDVSKAPGYRVVDANVEVVNRNGGILDVSRVKPPDAAKLKAYRATTGLDLAFGGDGGIQPPCPRAAQVGHRDRAPGGRKASERVACLDAGEEDRQVFAAKRRSAPRSRKRPISRSRAKTTSSSTMSA